MASSNPNHPAQIVARFLSANNYEKTLSAFLSEASITPTSSSPSAPSLSFTNPSQILTLEQLLHEKYLYDTSLSYSKSPPSSTTLSWTTPAPSVPQQLTFPPGGVGNILHVSIELLPTAVTASSNSSSNSATISTSEALRPHILVTSADRRLLVFSLADTNVAATGTSPIDQTRANESTKAPTSLEVAPSRGLTHSAPILSFTMVPNSGGRQAIGTSMSGSVFLIQITPYGMSVISERHDHTKYCVRAAVRAIRSPRQKKKQMVVLATAGWDRKVCLYWIKGGEGEAEQEKDREEARVLLKEIPPPAAVLSLDSVPEDILLLEPPQTATLSTLSGPNQQPQHEALNQPEIEDPTPILLLSRRDSTKLYYYSTSPFMTQTSSSTLPHSDSTTIPTTPSLSSTSAPTSTTPSLPLLTTQNLSPHTTLTWTTFTPSCIRLSPHDPTLAAIATSHIPHMKLLLVRLLMPSSTSSTPSISTIPSGTPSAAPKLSDTGPSIEVQSAAILLHTSTLAPQTAYSSPLLCWRPDGSGVWVNGDDGVVRGVETASGKVVEKLVGGHEEGVKVRGVWGGGVEMGMDGKGEGDEGKEGEGRREEWVVSGGFDRRGVVWRVES